MEALGICGLILFIGCLVALASNQIIKGCIDAREALSSAKEQVMLADYDLALLRHYSWDVDYTVSLLKARNKVAIDIETQVPTKSLISLDPSYKHMLQHKMFLNQGFKLPYSSRYITFDEIDENIWRQSLDACGLTKNEK